MITNDNLGLRGASGEPGPCEHPTRSVRGSEEGGRQVSRHKEAEESESWVISPRMMCKDGDGVAGSTRQGVEGAMAERGCPGAKGALEEIYLQGDAGDASPRLTLGGGEGV